MCQQLILYVLAEFDITCGRTLLAVLNGWKFDMANWSFEDGLIIGKDQTVATVRTIRRHPRDMRQSFDYG